MSICEFCEFDVDCEFYELPVDGIVMRGSVGRTALVALSFLAGDVSGMRCTYRARVPFNC
jgi:hypothetical protein